MNFRHQNNIYFFLFLHVDSDYLFPYVKTVKFQPRVSRQNHPQDTGV